MQTRFVGAAVGLSLCLGGQANADGMVVGPPDLGPLPYHAMTWSGFYVGGQVGHGFGDGDVFVDSQSRLDTTRGFGTRTAKGFDDGSDDDGGWFGGGHMGYNFQRGHLVFGIEADINGSDIDLGKATARSLAPRGDEGDFAAGVTTTSAEIDWFGTVRARLGVAHGPLLAYVTGGLAYGDVSLNSTVNLSSSFDEGEDLRDVKRRLKDSSREVGWTLGGGVDYAISPRVVFGVSYQYVDLGDLSHRASLTETRLLGGPNNFSDVAEVRGSADVDTSFHTLQARLSIKFGREDRVYEPLK